MLRFSFETVCKGKNQPKGSEEIRCQNEEYFEELEIAS
jgi:hypothetical protein